MATHGVSPFAALCVWVALVWAASAVAFLIARPIFRAWDDQGYALARITGPLLTGVVGWLLAASGLSRVTPISSIVLCVGLALAAAVVWRLDRRAPLPSGRRVLLIDAVFLACVAVFATVRAWSPSIIGAERPMDHALLAAVLAQGSAPPIDPWLAGHVANYHTAGYAWWAPLGILIQQPPWVVYNLVLTVLPAQLAVCAAAIGRRLHETWGWLAAMGLVLWGPWSALVLAARGGVRGELAVTRVLPHTINEFPLFSLVWGDLHAHVLALPLLVALAAVVLRLHEVTTARDVARRPTLLLTGVAAAIATACVLTSSWDVAPVVLAGATVMGILATRAPRLLPAAVLVAVLPGVAIAWPVLTTFRPPPVPVGIEWAGSPLGPFLLVTGAWLAPVALVVFTRPWSRRWAAACIAAAAVMTLLPSLSVRALLGVLAIGLWRARDAVGRPAATLGFAGLALLGLAECVWVDDIYGAELRRVNTVFKWHLHAIAALALALPGLAHALWNVPAPHARRVGRIGLVGLVAAALLAGAYVPAVRWLRREPGFTLDGLAAMARRWPGDAAAVRHLWHHAAPTDVVLEAPGQAYSYGSRLSFMSGRPALIGWQEHERLWRRGPEWNAILTERAALVAALYTGPPDALAPMLADARVRYVVVGEVERRRYPGITPARFRDVADVVVDEKGTVLLRVR